MTVIVQMVVRAPDVDRFAATSQKYAPMMEEAGIEGLEWTTHIWHKKGTS